MRERPFKLSFDSRILHVGSQRLIKIPPFKERERIRGTQVVICKIKITPIKGEREREGERKT